MRIACLRSNICAAHTNDVISNLIYVNQRINPHIMRITPPPLLYIVIIMYYSPASISASGPKVHKPKTHASRLCSNHKSQSPPTWQGRRRRHRRATFCQRQNCLRFGRTPSTSLEVSDRRWSALYTCVYVHTGCRFYGNPSRLITLAHGNIGRAHN